MTGQSPKPEVVYLPALFRAIKAGEIRIPAFQRGFVWKPTQVLTLLESVYSSYPIGSLLFWHVDASMMRSADKPEAPFPHPEVSGKVDFVLDGMQRISSLYGSFNPRDMPPEEDVFAVVFDLATERFLHVRDRTESSIELRRLFTPRLLLEEQARLGALKDGDTLVERSLELQRRFQEYLVPVVRISSPDSSEVVRIFERINSTGTTLGAVDFMRALTWSREFDLTDVLVDLTATLEAEGFDVPEDTIAKCLALEVDVLPIATEMVKLRGKDPRELHAAVQRTREALTRSVEYFRSIGIRSYDYVPYEGQFLVFASTAAGLRSSQPPEWLRRWYWSVGFSEALQGRPDHLIARLAVQARNDPTGGIVERLNLSREALKVRPMRKGAALPVTFVAALATTSVHSVVSGQPIPTAELLSAYDTSMVAPVYDRHALAEVIAPRTRTDKVVANSVILSPQERGLRLTPGDLRAAILRLAEQEGGMDKLRTQCIDDACIEALRDNRADRFVEARANAIVALASELTG